MSKVFQIAMYVVFVGIVVMVVGDVWHMSAVGDYTSAETRYISGLSDYNDDTYISALWDMHEAQNDMVLSGVIFDIGFIMLAFGVAMIAYGLHEREQPRPAYPIQQPVYQPQYPGYGVPPGYQQVPQEPPQQRQ